MDTHFTADPRFHLSRNTSDDGAIGTTFFIVIEQQGSEIVVEPLRNTEMIQFAQTHLLHRTHHYGEALVISSGKRWTDCTDIRNESTAKLRGNQPDVQMGGHLFILNMPNTVRTRNTIRTALVQYLRSHGWALNLETTPEVEG